METSQHEEFSPMTQHRIVENEDTIRERWPMLFCPLTLELFQDPVVANDGHTYERSAIMQHMASRQQSPLTRQHLNSNLYPNRALAQMISKLEQRGDIIIRWSHTLEKVHHMIEEWRPAFEQRVRARAHQVWQSRQRDPYDRRFLHDPVAGQVNDWNWALHTQMREESCIGAIAVTPTCVLCNWGHRKSVEVVCFPCLHACMCSTHAATRNSCPQCRTECQKIVLGNFNYL